MASHLTVTSAVSGGAAVSRGLNAQAGIDGPEAGVGNVLDLFAALLGGATASAAAIAPDVSAQVSQSAQASGSYRLGNLVDLSFEFGGDKDAPAEDPELIAAAVQAVLPIQTNEPTVSAADLTDLINGLAQIKSSIQTDEPLDPELLKRVDATLDKLAASLNINLDDLPSLTDLTAMLAKAPPVNGSVEAQLTAALEPMTRSLLTGEATAVASADIELPALVKSIGDKLAGLVQAINEGKVQLPPVEGVDVSAAIDPELEAAIRRLTISAEADVTVPEVALTTPTLKLTEPVLTGRPRPAGEPLSDVQDEPAPPNTTPPATAVAKPDTDPRTPTQPSTPDVSRTLSDSKPSEEKKVAATVEGRPDPKPAATPASTPAPQADVMPDPKAAAVTAVPVARADVSAPRVVQAGYQTSQQQLNLPQLAFEVVRQANDGNTRFQIRLDPAELGKIDVRLDIDATGKVNARLTVEKAETLDMMQRDQRGLERALQQAGLDSSKTNLEFSLKQNPFSSGGQQGYEGGQGRQPGQQSAQGNGSGSDADEAPAPTVSLYRASLTASGINIVA